MKKRPMTLRRVAPLLLLAAVPLLYPVADPVLTDATSLARVAIGRITAELGVLPARDTLALGIYRPEVPYALDQLALIEQKINRRFTILSIYTTWGEREEDRFPATLLNEVNNHGAIAMVTWEPWTTEFASTTDRLAAASRTDMRSIAAGHYDAYIRQWARGAVIYGRSFLLRFGHEMNNPQYPWSTAAGNAPTDFIDAWRHVWHLFREEGATNVSWVWSPRGRPPRDLYPGGEYVDWIGTSVFNYGPYGDGAWYSFEFLYESIYRSALAFDRPIMIAELGCVAEGGSQGEWYADAMQKLATKYPATRAVVIYNNPADYTASGSPIDWSIDDNSQALKALGAGNVSVLQLH